MWEAKEGYVVKCCVRRCGIVLSSAWGRVACLGGSDECDMVDKTWGSSGVAGRGRISKGKTIHG